ncbi:conserved hypothetical protein [Talaromyces stipitatus ATCC 10500]|uniref:Nucleoside phosphorylase domain-containing protein n=1 Tax=Talaromyces stipitatus (strain ATCC 10500 / CBS 375.48 / QM 6759 / NRRL 1006) TaxID=441959 RepID=B8M3J2_TALSN|nr:uncharacterized protein TSTA_096130 [Talaromyces stipitatus ATCC 10500]EED22364.1 conserved hypothetical protein [Talaromyces stipitatus ATCC 10500]
MDQVVPSLQQTAVPLLEQARPLTAVPGAIALAADGRSSSFRWPKYQLLLAGSRIPSLGFLMSFVSRLGREIRYPWGKCKAALMGLGTVSHVINDTQNNFTHDDYTIAWICALPLEMAAATTMLDEIHRPLPQHPTDPNAYTVGRLRSHNIVIACLPSGMYGTTSAATVLSHMLPTFPSLQFGLMVDIGGGVPSKKVDIRLGDVVVSMPTASSGGVG